MIISKGNFQIISKMINSRWEKMNEIREGKMYEVLLDAKNRLNGVPISEKYGGKFQIDRTLRKKFFKISRGPQLNIVHGFLF